MSKKFFYTNLIIDYPDRGKAEISTYGHPLIGGVRESLEVFLRSDNYSPVKILNLMGQFGYRFVPCDKVNGYLFELEV